MTSTTNIHCTTNMNLKLEVCTGSNSNWIEINAGEHELILFFTNRAQLLDFIAHARQRLNEPTKLCAA